MTDDKNIDQMRDKSKALNDSLKTLAEDGLEKLARAATQATRHTPVQKPAGDIVQAELNKALRQEILSGIGNIFSGGETSAKSAPVNVVIHNNAQAAVSVTERTDAFDQKQLEITIDQMVADSLMRGRQTTGVMRALFGLMPGLNGR